MGHAAFVVGVVFVDQHDALNLVVGFVEFAKDVNEVVGDGLVADDFAELYLAVEVAVEHSQVAQGGARNGAVLLVRLALHMLEDGIADGVGLEAGVDAIGFDGFIADDSGRCPLAIPYVGRFLIWLLSI